MANSVCFYIKSGSKSILYIEKYRYGEQHYHLEFVVTSHAHVRAGGYVIGAGDTFIYILYIIYMTK